MTNVDITLMFLVLIISIGFSVVVIIQYNEIIVVKENLTIAESQLDACKQSVELCVQQYNEVRP